jgi:hypothetical protein
VVGTPEVGNFSPGCHEVFDNCGAGRLFVKSSLELLQFFGLASAVVWKSLSGRDSLSQRAARLVRWTFGLCSIDFGLAHLTAVWTVVPMIPKWMLFGATFWAVLTGIAFVLAGAAIVSGVLDVLAASLLGLMLLVFSALALGPLIFSFPRAHWTWGAHAYNLTAVGAAWIVAEWLATRGSSFGTGKVQGR